MGPGPGPAPGRLDWSPYIGDAVELVRLAGWLYPVATTDELEKLLAEARTRPPMTAAEREEQTRNFAAGNVGLENPAVTRAVVDEAARRYSRRSK